MLATKQAKLKTKFRTSSRKFIRYNLEKLASCIWIINAIAINATLNKRQKVTKEIHYFQSLKLKNNSEIKFVSSTKRDKLSNAIRALKALYNPHFNPFTLAIRKTNML